jgi:hypothetical protein
VQKKWLSVQQVAIKIMQNNLNILPADLLSRLDQALPLFTDAAIRGEFLHGLYLFCAGLFICVAFMFLCWYWRRSGESFICFVAAMVGFGMMVMHIPSVVAPEAVLAREILSGM